MTDKPIAFEAYQELMPEDRANDLWNGGPRGYYTGQARSIGKLLLLARRLCEAGCGFVTIHADYEGVWDMHADNQNLNMLDGMEAVARVPPACTGAYGQPLDATPCTD